MRGNIGFKEDLVTDFLYSIKYDIYRGKQKK